MKVKKLVQHRYIKACKSKRESRDNNTIQLNFL